MNASDTEPRGERRAGAGSALEVWAVFLKLGLSSFGGPIAHVSYFHRELIHRRRWLDETRYAQLVALCQSLPGPASSQLGFALGMIRGRWLGALAAFVAFTTPSAVLLFAFARVLPRLEQPYGQAVLHALKLVAVAVVAQGVLVMARRLTPDAPRALIAAAACAVIALSASPGAQLFVIFMGAALGLVFCRPAASASAPFETGYRARTGTCLLGVFAILLLAAIAAQSNNGNASLVSIAAAFYRAGALVFGGGHVVLPLLQQAVVAPGWVSTHDFLAGYGAAQAVPGPMFSLAAFLGARLPDGHGGIVGALVALAAIFLPGLLLISGALPLWRDFAARPRSLRALAGVNAAVVGLLAAALYSPVWTSAVRDPADFATVLVGFILLVATRSSVVIVLGWCILASAVRVWFA